MTYVAPEGQPLWMSGEVKKNLGTFIIPLIVVIHILHIMQAFVLKASSEASATHSNGHYLLPNTSDEPFNDSPNIEGDAKTVNTCFSKLFHIIHDNIM